MAFRNGRRLVVTVLAGLALAACGGEGGEGDEGGPTMQPGNNCLACHVQGGKAGEAAFTAAGTVYASPTAAANEGIQGVEVRLTDAAGKTVALTTNSVGNFYTDEPLSFPLRAELRLGTSVARMPIPIQNGGCATCHTPPPAGGAPGRLYISQ